MGKNQFFVFLKNYILSGVYIILYIPKLLIGLILLLLPGYIIAILVFVIISPKSLGPFGVEILSLGFIDRMSSLEQLIFAGIGIFSIFFIYGGTKWGGLVKKISQFHDYE